MDLTGTKNNTKIPFYSKESRSITET